MTSEATTLTSPFVMVPLILENSEPAIQIMKQASSVPQNVDRLKPLSVQVISCVGVTVLPLLRRDRADDLADVATRHTFLDLTHVH